MSLEKLTTAFVNILEIVPEEVCNELSYSEHPTWDSMSHMMLIAELEGEFDIMLDTDDIIDMSSFLKAQHILAKYGVSFD
ncbi:acyl carrier protein [Pseudoalteromonas sp. SWN29]|uniref:acyl carrier protein n=1 Tax=Pseudoalteromonas sp. SWN29 TaxID=2792064 RepID=UPI0018CD98D0|nr:acyl carrier protein [Pseudoalteromonas sp. SWN29]